MEAKFKKGDKVHVVPDMVTIYEVQEVKETAVAFFYDVSNGSTKLTDVPEMNLQLA